MGFLDFLKGSTESNYPVSKQELQSALNTMKKLDDIFFQSKILTALDGRNRAMHSHMLSYRGMLAFIYEHDCHYGSHSEFISSSEETHYTLVEIAMSDKSHRNKSVLSLPTNWKDVEQVIYALKLEKSDDAQKLTSLSSEIASLKSILQRLQ